MQRIKSGFQKYWPIGIILLLEILLFATNYLPKTYLIGWDNLFPEFNFGLNIQRSIFAIWQEYRGLGLLDGMSHAANLVHYLFIFILSFFLPQSILRYVFIFLTHILGGIGMYLLISNFLYPLFREDKYKKTIALFGALFYQYNLATIQMYYLPFELFVTHFAALPWSLLALRKFLVKPDKRNLIFLTVVSLLSTPQAHVPSVFLVYAFALGVVLLFTLLQNGRRILKTVIVAAMIIFLTNSYWGIPYVYSTAKNAKVIAESKNNQMGTDDIFLRNQAYGDFTDVAQLKGLSLDFVQYDYTQKISNYMMQPWREHTSQVPVVLAAWILFISSIFGIVHAMVKKQKELYSFVFLWIITFLILGNDIPILGFFSYSLRTYIPYFYNVFRFVFTKFSLLYVAMYSVLSGYGLYQIFIFLEIKAKKNLGIFLATLSFGLLGIIVFPVFQGNFFYKNLKVPIPSDYFQTFNFFANQNYNQRIAILPTPWYWAWTQTNWGAIGSGFIWFGLPQPVLDRAFDPWSDKNENFYWEVTQAIYSGNSTLFENLIKKYQIDWLILDESIIYTSSPKVININKLKEFLLTSGNLSLAATFGKLNIYRVNPDINPKDSVFLADGLPVTGPSYKWNNDDKAYEEYGNYITNNKEQITNNNLIYYPFRSLFTGRQQNELEFQVGETADYFSFKTTIPKTLVGDKLVLPQLDSKEVTELDTNDLSQSVAKVPQVFLDGEYIPYVTTSASAIDLPYINGGNLEIRVPKINGYYSSNISPTTLNLQSKSCDQFSSGLYKHDQIDIGGERLLQLTSINSSNCLDFDLPLLSQNLSYLITVQNKNVGGKSLLFSVINKNSQRADLETYLPKATGNRQQVKIDTSYFVIPPMEQHGQGYTIHLDNISIGREKTINDLGRITVNPIPYRFLTSMKIIKDVNYQPSTTYDQPLSVSHSNPSLYQVDISNRVIGQTSNPVLILSQSFDSGWRAYQLSTSHVSLITSLFPFLFGQEINNHILVNNWGNGWVLSGNRQQAIGNRNETIIIVYLPQYLEYVGFILLGVAIFIVILYPKQTHDPQLTAHN